MSHRTVFLSRLIGLYCILVSFALAAHRQDTVETTTALIHTPPVLFLVGIIALIAGIAMVLGHNIWSGGALPITVTVVGWVTLIRGVVVLFLPPGAEVALSQDFTTTSFSTCTWASAPPRRLSGLRRVQAHIAFAK